MLEIIEGPHVGQQFAIRDGTEIGRVRGQILLKKDTKVSSFHAAISLDAKGQLVITDQGSSNGIKINGNKVKTVLLRDGVQFQIGRSVFRVIERTEAEVEAHREPEPPKSWDQILVEAIPNLTLNSRLPKQILKPFERPLQLNFVEGLQADETLTLGFGPRDFGSDNLDIELKEAISPATAFSISPSESGALLTTDFPRLVRVNGNTETTVELKDGDTIRIGTTLIQVVLKEQV